MYLHKFERLWLQPVLYIAMQELLLDPCTGSVILCMHQYISQQDLLTINCLRQPGGQSRCQSRRRQDGASRAMAVGVFCLLSNTGSGEQGVLPDWLLQCCIASSPEAA